MALIQTSLIWVAYAVAIAILLAIASIFVFLYQKPTDRAASVTIVCIFTTLALLATVLLIPVDVALVSSTSRSSLGQKKDWATPEKVHDIVRTLEIVYYTLYSLDALLCLIVVPFTYFWYEEYDEDAAEHGEQTAGQRIWGAFKYTIAFILFVVIIFLIGFFVPFAKQAKDDKRLDLDYFKHLLSENRKHHFLPSHTTANVNRWRTRSCVRAWSSHDYRYCPLCPLHGCWNGHATSSHDQVGSLRLHTHPSRQHRFAT
jgi:LMBR1 domain-containing protein 1